MTTLAEEMKFDETQPLDFTEIARLCKHRVKDLQLLFVDLETIKGRYTLSRFLPAGVNVSAILLTSRIKHKLQRHWTVLIRTNKKIEFFDPLALGKTMLDVVLGDKGKFTAFLKQIKAEFNTRAVQQRKEDVRTCGLHAVSRIFKHKLDNKTYERWILSIKSLKPDQLVAILTYFGHMT